MRRLNIIYSILIYLGAAFALYQYFSGGKPARPPAKPAVPLTDEQKLDDVLKTIDIAGMEKDTRPAYSLRIIQVERGSQAQAQHISLGDLIVRANGEPVRGVDELQDQLSGEDNAYDIWSPKGTRLIPFHHKLGVWFDEYWIPELDYIHGKQRNPAWDKYVVAAALFWHSEPGMARRALEKARAAGYTGPMYAGLLACINCCSARHEDVLKDEDAIKASLAGISPRPVLTRLYVSMLAMSRIDAANALQKSHPEFRLQPADWNMETLMDRANRLSPGDRAMLSPDSRLVRATAQDFSKAVVPMNENAKVSLAHLKRDNSFDLNMEAGRWGDCCFGPLTSNPSISLDFTMISTATRENPATGYLGILLVDTADGTGAYVLQFLPRTNGQVDLLAEGYAPVSFNSPDLLHVDGQKNHVEIHMAGAWYEIWLNGRRLMLGLASREDREYSVSIGCSGARSIVTNFAFAELKGSVEPIAKLDTPAAADLKIPAEPKDAGLRWFHDAFVNGYLNGGGHRSPAWDAYALTALSLAGRMYGRDSDSPELYDILQNCRKAISQGCKDPLLYFVYAEIQYRFSVGMSAKAGRAYRQAADNLAGSKYHPLLQFIILNQCIQFESISSMQPIRERAVNRSKAAADLIPGILEDKQIPAHFLYHVFDERLNRNILENMDRKTEFDRFFAQLERTAPNHSATLTAKGCFYLRYAWDARGSGWASEVTPQGWKLFRERLIIAKTALSQAAEADPKNAVALAELITVELGLSTPGQLNAFKRATAADKSEILAYANQLNAIQPRWGGSREQLMSLGRSCFENMKDDPSLDESVGSMLLRAHESCVEDAVLAGRDGFETQTIRETYWRSPAVWQDVQDVYGVLLKRHPASRLYKSEFAYYAAKCEQWDVAARLLNELGSEWATASFGGPDAAYATKQKVMQRAGKK